MREMKLGFDNLRTLYPEDKYILLLPTVSKFIIANRPMYSLDVTTVKIDPDDKTMVYPVKERYENGESVATEVGLSKVSLDLICAAADIDVATEPIGGIGNPMHRVYRAVARIRSSNGEIRSRTATVEWEGDVVREKIAMAAVDSCTGSKRRGWTSKAPLSGLPWKDLTDDQMQREIEHRTAKNWLQEREFGKRKAESKAARNAIRSLVAMKATYDPAELRRKEFAVAKLVLTPDMDDPVQKRAVIEAGLMACGRLYGADAARLTGGLFLPDGSGEAARQLVEGVEQMRQDPEPEPADITVAEFDPPQATAPVTDLRALKEQVVLDNWDQAAPYFEAIEAALRTWTGEPGMDETIRAYFLDCAKSKNTQGVQYIVNYIITNGGRA